jgi:hypothetical protein
MGESVNTVIIQTSNGKNHVHHLDEVMGTADAIPESIAVTAMCFALENPAVAREIIAGRVGIKIVAENMNPHSN